MTVKGPVLQHNMKYLFLSMDSRSLSIDFIRIVCLITLSLIVLSGCGTQQVIEKNQSLKVNIGQQLPNEKKIKQSLYTQHQNWKATRYKLGGLSKKGIDCSGFVYLTFLSQFGIKLPRTTSQQADVGVKINNNDLKSGDLVFFKTGFKDKHVGIYLENRQFLHASSSKGVMISSIDNIYWKKKYWKATRL